jgi:hypothetical protein
VSEEKVTTLRLEHFRYDRNETEGRQYRSPFPELKGRFSTPTGRGHATNVRAARANAMRDLLKQVKGKKFRNATATISFWNYHSGVINKFSGALCNGNLPLTPWRRYTDGDKKVSL